MISPALSDPRTVLAQFSFNKATLPAFIAMCMPDCPRPTSVAWLSERIGISSHNTIYAALRYMQNTLGLCFQVGFKKAGGLWWLADTVRQVALPFVAYLRPEDTRPFLLTLAPAPDSDPDITGPRLISGAPDSDPDITGTRLISGAPDGATDQQKIIRKKRELFFVDQLLDPNLQDHDLDFLDPTIEAGAIIRKNRELLLLLLNWMEFWPEALAEFASREPTPYLTPGMALAAYWYATVGGYDSPPAFVRLCLDHRRAPTTPYTALSAAWLEMEMPHRRTVIKALRRAPRHPQRHVILPRDFGWRLPYRELLLTWSACNGRFAPPELMPTAAEADDDDFRYDIPVAYRHIVKR
ncbi:MAG: hypothetical protein KF770_17630 [Anaerolineae bacterium]|nr:hypothetical protein [Anaerolineae bacterium]